MKDISRGIHDMLDGNWANDSMGVVEEVKSEVCQIKSFLVSLITHLISRDVITINDIKNNFEDGWKFDYDIKGR